MSPKKLKKSRSRQLPDFIDILINLLKTDYSKISITIYIDTSQ